MATDVERLIVTLEARTKEYERALAKAQNTTVTQLRKIEGSMAASAKRQQAIWAKAGAGIQATMTRAFAPLAAVAAGALGGRAIVDFADSFTKIENSLRVAGVAGDDLAVTMENLFQIATKHGAPVEALGVLYGRLALVQRELNISSEDLLGFTDNVAASLRVSGKSAAEASGALLQLSQALGSGVVRAEEFNSILEGAPAIAQAVARGLTEAGGSVARLRQLVIDGQISSEAFFKAFQLGSIETQRQALLAERTISQAWENIKTSLTDVIGSLDDATSASRFFAEELDNLAEDLKSTGEEIEAIVSAGNKLVDVFNKLTTLSPPAAEGLGLAGLRTSIEQWEKLLEQAEARGETAAAENMRARIAELEAEIVAGMNTLVGPAFERGGRQGAEAFAAGFKSISIKDAMANDLAGALDAVLESRKKEFSSLLGGGSGGRKFGHSFALPKFDSSGAAEQLQALIRQREEVEGLTSDLARLETALSAHFDTPFDDIMGFGAADAAQAAFAQAIIDLEALSQRFIDGKISALAFDDRVAGIKARLESLAGTGHELDPFIADMLKATSVAGQLQNQLEQAKNAINSMGGGFTSQSFSVPKSGGGVLDVNVIRHEGFAKGIEAGNKPVVTATDRVTAGIALARAETGRIVKFVEASKTQVDDLVFHMERTPEEITAAIQHQTNELGTAIKDVAQAVVETGQVFTSSLKLSVGGAEQKQIDALARERDVISAGLQFKQLSPADEQAAQLRLAEIDLQTAKLNQQMGEAEDALQSLVPMISDMNQAGRTWAQITQRVSMEMKHLTGTAPFQPLPLTGMGFAGGGEVRGPGGPRSDSVPIMASAGEFVVNAAATKKHRALLESINSGAMRMMATGGLVDRVNGAAQRLANGGMVQAAPAAASRGDIHLSLGGVHVAAQDGGVSRQSARDAGRQVAREVAYHMREMGIS